MHNETQMGASQVITPSLSSKDRRERETEREREREREAREGLVSGGKKETLPEMEREGERKHHRLSLAAEMPPGFPAHVLGAPCFAQLFPQLLETSGMSLWQFSRGFPSSRGGERERTREWCFFFSQANCRCCKVRQFFFSAEDFERAG